MPAPTPFSQLLHRLGRGNEPIRLGHNDNATFLTNYVEPDLVDESVASLVAAQRNVWFEVNPSLYAAERGRSSAAHITRLTALWADLDFKDSGLGSEDGAWAVIDDLSAALGVQPAVIVHSGNGLQPYWPILDGQIHTANRDDVALLLKRWGAFVKRIAENNGGTADSVFDLPRILRVPGTFNVKDVANPKPTTAEFRDAPDLEMSEVREILNEYGVEVDEVEVTTERISPAAEWEWAESNCSFVDTAHREIASSRPGSRHHWALKWSGIIYGMIRSGCVTEEGFENLRAALVNRFQWLLDNEGSSRPFAPREMEAIFKEGLKMAESWSKTKLGTEMRSHLHSGFVEAFAPDEPQWTPPVPGTPAAAVQDAQALATTGATNVSSIFTKQPIANVASFVGPSPEQGALALQMNESAQQRLQSARYTDVGNAERLGQWLAGRFIYVPDLDWMEWDGSRYLPDEDGRVVEATKDLFVHMATTSADDAQREWALKSLSRSKINATMELAKTVTHLVVPPRKLDSQAYELNTPAGIVSLRTGELRRADPRSDFHMMRTAITPERMEIPRFTAFLRWAMGEESVDLGSQSRILYLQRLFGLACIGELLQHVFPMGIGVGANGKSTLLDIMLAVLGSYGTQLAPKFLVETRGERHPTELADLRGIRLAVAPEVPPTSTFDEELVKRVTGESMLKARYMGKDFFSFPNTATIWMNANHLPSVRAGGSSFWRRARKIDFGNIAPLSRQNPNLAREIFADEGPGILQWMIDGAIAVQRTGLLDPDSVLVATRDYQLEEDTIARFIDSELIVDESAQMIQVDRAVIYELYRQWTFRNGGNPLNSMKFARELTTLLPSAGLGDKTVFTHVRQARAVMPTAGDDE